MQCCPLSSCDDGDSPDFYNQRVLTAAKTHKCTECREPILKGSQYERVDGVWEGYWTTHKTCMTCVEIRDHFSCEGWIFGQLWEDLAENFFPNMKAGGPCMEGLSPAAKQCLFDACLAWKLSGGNE